MNNYNVAQRINSQVNASVTYKTDLAQFEVPELAFLQASFSDNPKYLSEIFLAQSLLS